MKSSRKPICWMRTCNVSSQEAREQAFEAKCSDTKAKVEVLVRLFMVRLWVGHFPSLGPCGSEGFR